MAIGQINLPQVIFFGTPAFAVPTLEALKREGFLIKVIVTQPDRPAGRGQKVTASPVKSWAQANSVLLLQPANLKNNLDLLGRLKNRQPQIIVVVAYGLILSQEILDLPQLGCVNLHPSLLPKYRGAAPIETAILRGEKETGLTTILMDARMDAGPILLQERLTIGDTETAGQLSDRLSLKGAELVVATVKGLTAGRIKPEPQAETEASYTPLLKREDGFIDWEKPAIKLFNMIRAYLPKPGPYTYWSDTRLNIVEADLASETGPPKAPPGTILEFTAEGSGRITTGRGQILIKKIKPAGGRAMILTDFARGHGLKAGDVLEYRPTHIE